MRDFFFENSPKCLTPSLDRAVQAVPGEHVLWEEKGIIPALGRALFWQCLGIAISHFDFATVLWVLN